MSSIQSTYLPTNRSHRFGRCFEWGYLGNGSRVLDPLVSNNTKFLWNFHGTPRTRKDYQIRRIVPEEVTSLTNGKHVHVHVLMILESYLIGIRFSWMMIHYKVYSPIYRLPPYLSNIITNSLRGFCITIGVPLNLYHTPELFPTIGSSGFSLHVSHSSLDQGSVLVDLFLIFYSHPNLAPNPNTVAISELCDV